jgi:hypothetical protein
MKENKYLSFLLREWRKEVLKTLPIKFTNRGKLL